MVTFIPVRDFSENSLPEPAACSEKNPPEPPSRPELFEFGRQCLYLSVPGNGEYGLKPLESRGLERWLWSRALWAFPKFAVLVNL